MVKKKRQNSKLTQKEIEKICGISQSCFSRYENNVRTPSPIVAKKIALILGFDWTKFYDDENENKDFELNDFLEIEK